MVEKWLGMDEEWMRSGAAWLQSAMTGRQGSRAVECIVGRSRKADSYCNRGGNVLKTSQISCFFRVTACYRRKNSEREKRHSKPNLNCTPKLNRPNFGVHINYGFGRANKSPRYLRGRTSSPAKNLTLCRRNYFRIKKKNRVFLQAVKITLMIWHAFFTILLEIKFR